MNRDVAVFLLSGAVIGLMLCVALLVSMVNATSADHKAQLNRVIELLEKKP